MKNKLLSMLLAVLLPVMALACKKAEDAPVEETPAPTPDAAIVVVEQLPVHSDTWEDILNEEVEPPSPTPFGVSPTTGREIDISRAYQPTFVCYDNAAAGRPLSGIAEADIVYEAPASDGGDGTRLMALFCDAFPAQVGPVGMLYGDFASVQKEWGGMVIHEGYPSQSGYPKLADADFIMRVTNAGDAKEFFFSQEDTKGLFVNLEGLVPGLYTSEPAEAGLRFLLAEGYAYAGASSAKKIILPFNGGKSEAVQYVFDPEAGQYMRYQTAADGRMLGAAALSWNEEMGALESVPLYINSLIVQYAEKDEGGLAVVGSGKCDFFVGGVQVSGTWSRATKADATAYYLDDGSVVTLETGHTWIALHPAETPAQVS